MDPSADRRETLKRPSDPQCISHSTRHSGVIAVKNCFTTNSVWINHTAVIFLWLFLNWQLVLGTQLLTQAANEAVSSAMLAPWLLPEQIQNLVYRNMESTRAVLIITACRQCPILSFSSNPLGCYLRPWGYTHRWIWHGPPKDTCCPRHISPYTRRCLECYLSACIPIRCPLFAISICPSIHPTEYIQ